MPLSAAVGVLIVPIIFEPPGAWADGFRFPYQDSAAIAQANAFRAQVDNPSAIFYNPAGMTQLHGVQYSAGVQFLSPEATFRSPAGATAENSRPGGAVALPPPVQMFITANLKDLDVDALGDLSIGFGFTFFAFSNDWPEDGPFATKVTKTQMPLLDFKPTAAYKVNDYLSLGLGADIYTFLSFVGEGQYEQQFIANGMIPGTTAGDMLELNGTGTTAGLNASFLLTPMRTSDGKPRVNLGFIWRSQAVLPLKGELLANGRKVANASTQIRLPEMYESGLAVWPIRNDGHEWKVEVDVDYVRWSSIRNFDVFLSNGVVLADPQNWSDSVTVGAGTEYKWLRPADHLDWEYAVRVGFGYSPTPIPDANFNPAFPDSNSYNIAAGMGFFCQGNGRFLWLVQCGDAGAGDLWRKGMALDLAYLVNLNEPRTVTGNPNPTVDGTYKKTMHIGSITFRVNF